MPNTAATETAEVFLPQTHDGWNMWFEHCLIFPKAMMAPWRRL